jgi:hypothetical protein
MVRCTDTRRGVKLAQNNTPPRQPIVAKKGLFGKRSGCAKAWKNRRSEYTARRGVEKASAAVIAIDRYS